MNEPKVTINGTQLTEGQAMTLRVALATFATNLIQDGLGDDAHGLAMAKAYLGNIEAICNLIFKP